MWYSQQIQKANGVQNICLAGPMLTGYLQQHTKVGSWREAGAEQVLWEQECLISQRQIQQFDNTTENQNWLNSL